MHPVKPNPGRVFLVLAGITATPFVLTAWIGAPIPHSWPTSEQVETLLRGVTVDHLHAVFRILIWAAWLAVLIGSVWEIAAYLAHRVHPGVAARRPWFVRLTGGLALGATATTTLAAGAPTAAIAATPDIDASPDEEAKQSGSTPTKGHQPRSTNSSTTEQPADESMYTVRSGDTLWEVSDDQLGDSEKWRSIYQHNKDKQQPEGGKLTDPDLLQPGWQLSIPTDRKPPDDPPPKADPPPDSDPPTEEEPTKPPHQSEDAPTNDASADAESASPETDQDTVPAGMWWSGSFVAAGFAAGLVLWLRLARRRVRAFEQRTGRAGPRIQLETPLPELESRIDPSTDIEREAGQPAALCVTDDGYPVTLTQACAGGLGLTGPGAEGVARATIAAALTAGDQDATSEGCDVVTTSPVLAELLTNAKAPPNGVHRLWIYPDSDEALRALSRDLVSRTRDPDALTPVLAILDDDADRTVLSSLLPQGKHLGIGALILGEWPDNTITIADDGTTDTDAPQHCYTLTSDAFDATLSTLDDIAEALEEPITPPPDDFDDSSLGAEDGTTIDPHFTDGPAADPAAPDLFEAAVPAADSNPKRPTAQDSPALIPAVGIDKPTPAEAQADPDVPLGKPLRMRLLGKFELTFHGEPVRIRRAKSRELLAYLATQTHATGLETLMETIVAETAFNKARNHFDAIVTYARKDLRQATGEPKTTMFILHRDGTYRLHPDWFTSDATEFDNLVTDAKTTADVTARVEALNAALELYTANFAADIDSESTWLYPIRSHYADQAHTVCLKLADHANSIGDTAIAITLLERAITINRHVESAYTKLITIHKDHGNFDAADKVSSRLKTALAQIGLTPRATELLLLNGGNRSSRQSTCRGSTSGPRLVTTTAR